MPQKSSVWKQELHPKIWAGVDGEGDLLLVRASLCRRCLTAVGHYFPYFFISFLVLTAVAKTPEGVVVGFQIFAWAPK